MMNTLHSQKRWKYFLIIFVIISFGLTGCKSSQKKEEKPDHFEKWRVLAEESRGSTPTPREYDLKLENEKKTASQTASASSSQRDSDSSTKAVEKPLPDLPVTMRMVDVDVPVLLRTLARAANVNIMINESVTGKANINIENLPWDKAFNGLLKTYGLAYQWADDILRVITVEDLNKEIALMEARQKFEKSKKQHTIAMLAIEKEEEKLDPLITRIVKIDYADLEPLRDNLEKYLLSMKKDLELSRGTADDTIEKESQPELRGAILMDKSSNSLILHATRTDIERILPIIAQLDRPSEQILIECHIVEANSDTAKELGIQWGGLGLHTAGSRNNTWIGGPLGTFDTSLKVSTEDATDANPAGSNIMHLPAIGTGLNFPSSDNATKAGWQGMTLGILNQSIGDYILYAQLTALEEEGKLNILSKPSITTMDHRKATIESGKEVPFKTTEDGESKIEFKKAVIKLEVTPHVVNNQVIRLDILTHKDELDWTNTVDGNPTIITKNAETKVNLFDGQTTVIGGLNKEKLQESESGVPWLKDIPGLGVLFKSNADAQDMEELLIFITPHILKERVEEKQPEKTSKNG